MWRALVLIVFILVGCTDKIVPFEGTVLSSTENNLEEQQFLNQAVINVKKGQFYIVSGPYKVAEMYQDAGRGTLILNGGTEYQIYMSDIWIYSKPPIRTDQWFSIGENQVVGPRGEAVADASGPEDAYLRLNELLAEIRKHGLIKSQQP